MSTEQSLYPPTKSCGCVKFVGGRKRRRTRRKRRKHHKKRKTHHRHKSHKRHRTRHRHKRRRTRHRRRKVGGDPLQKPGGLGGGYRETLQIQQASLPAAAKINRSFFPIFHLATKIKQHVLLFEK